MRRWGLKIVAILTLLTLALMLALPCVIRFVLPRINFEEYQIPLSSEITAKLEEITGDGEVKIQPRFYRASDGALLLKATGKLAGIPMTLSARLSSTYWFLRGTGIATLVLDSTPWKVDSSFAYDWLNWQAKANIERTEFTEKDPLIAPILARNLSPAVSNLVFSGAISFSAEAKRTSKLPVPTFLARGRLEGFDASCEIGNQHLVVKSFSTGLNVDGIADQVVISPIFTKAETVEVAGFILDNPYTNIIKLESAFLVTEAGAGICGGEVKLYSLFIDPNRENARCTLYFDAIDTGKLITHFPAFNGVASGRLYGRLPLSIKHGREIHLGRAYLYSNPGEGGELELYEPKTALSSLAAGGVNEETLENLSFALKDLKYEVLKLDFDKIEEGMALKIELHGSATRGKITVPVDLILNLRGDLEEIINTSIRATNLN